MIAHQISLEPSLDWKWPRVPLDWGWLMARGEMAEAALAL